MVVQSQENTLFVGFYVWGIHFWSYFLDSAISEKSQMATTQNFKNGIIWDLMVVEPFENISFVGFWVWGIHFWGYFMDLAILEKIKMASIRNTKVG